MLQRRTVVEAAMAPLPLRRTLLLCLLAATGCAAAATVAQGPTLPPRLSVEAEELRVTEGQKGVVLECGLDLGDDPIQYRWLKNHLWVTGSLGHAYRGYKRLFLALQPIRAAHAGRYICEAKNGAGADTKQITVNIESSVDTSSTGDTRHSAQPRTNEKLVDLAASLSDVLAEGDCDCDLMFLLHASPDAPPDLMSVQANLVHTITENIISEQVRVSILTYSDYVDMKMSFSAGTNKCALRKAFSNLSHQMWSTKIRTVLRDVFKKFKKSTKACKMLFLPIVGSAGPEGIDVLGAQHLKKVGVNIFLLEVTDEPIDGLSEMASQRGDGKPYHWRVPMPIWPSIVTYMQYMSEELAGCSNEGGDVAGVCIGDGGPCQQNEQCEGAGMGCVQGTCQTLECNVDPNTSGCCSVPGRFWCGDVTRNCTSSQSFCDGRVHCMNGRDEDTCWSRPCPENRVAQCESTTLCLALSELCDNVYHCPAGEDEDLNFCKRFPCPDDRSFRCRSGKCISTSKLCDGKFMDCEEGEDENLNYCYREHRCSGDKSFKCDYGVCMETSVVCDGTYNCLDATDELLCSRTACPVDRPFKCSNGECINIDMVCNGHADGCSDGSDEFNCSSFACPAERSFKCANGRCIDGWLKCNRGDDCGDGTDEFGCPYLDEPSYRTTPRPNFQSHSTHSPYSTYPTSTQGSVFVMCRADQFACRSGACIPEERVCDGRSSCLDGDDEVNCELRPCPSNRPHRCPNSHACVNAVVCDGVVDCPDGSDEDPAECLLANASGKDTAMEGGHSDDSEPGYVDETIADDITNDEYIYDDYSYDDMIENNSINVDDNYFETEVEFETDLKPEPESEPESEIASHPELEAEPEVQTHPETGRDQHPKPEVEPESEVEADNRDNENHNNHRHGYDSQPVDEMEKTMTVLEDDANPAASSDRSGDSGGCCFRSSYSNILLAVFTVSVLKLFSGW